MNKELKEQLNEAEYERKYYDTPQEYKDKDFNSYSESQIDKLLKIVYILAKENEELTDKVNELRTEIKDLDERINQLESS